MIAPAIFCRCLVAHLTWQAKQVHCCSTSILPAVTTFMPSSTIQLFMFCFASLSSSPYCISFASISDPHSRLSPYRDPQYPASAAALGSPAPSPRKLVHRNWRAGVAGSAAARFRRQETDSVSACSFRGFSNAHDVSLGEKRALRSLTFSSSFCFS